MIIQFEGHPHLQGADVKLGKSVVVELATLTEDGQGWGVWGVRIDGVLYREPRDLTPEPLEPGPFREMIEREAEHHVAALGKASA